jgi:hypothetical protein
MMQRILGSPYAAVVAGSLILVALLALLGGTIGGSYVLMVHYVTTLQAQQHAAQAKNAMGLCKAVQEMDLAGRGAVFSTGQAASYGHKLSAAIHQLFVSSGCSVLLGKGAL